MSLPILDPLPSGKPHDWSFTKIQLIAGKGELAPFPAEYKNPYVHHLARRDQKDRGTCVGQSTAYCYDLLYMALTKDLPTDTDKASYKKDVTDTLGTVHDILYPQSASAEAFYQMSRSIGNVTYPAGSEIRFSSRAWLNYGMNTETQWHTDKSGYCVWIMPPGARETTDGGLAPIDASVFAAKHRSEGYAQVGTPGGNCTWDEVCSAIYAKGFCLGAIPIYENYASMAGGDGAFPNPSGALAGFHALCFYGYDSDTLYLVHSWGDWCGMYGSISKEFFRTAQDLIQFFVILDNADVKIARDIHASCEITCDVPATVIVDGVVIGNAPQKIALEKGRTYLVTVKAEGYISETRTVDENVKELHFALEPLPPPKKTWWQLFIDWIMRIFRRE